MTDTRLTHRRIQCAIESMRAIGPEEVRAMTDEEIEDIRDAMRSPWLATENELWDRRDKRRINAEWPDAIEETAA